jgi:competence protein ComEA
MKFTKLQLIIFCASIIFLACGLIFFIISSQRTVRQADAGIISPPEETELRFTYEPIAKIVEPEGSAPANESVPGTKININAATIDELQNLPRIGPKIAEAIIEYRNENGPFKMLDELSNIRGIGARSIEKYKDLAYCGEFKAVEKHAAGSKPEKGDNGARESNTAQTDSGCGPGKININKASADELETLPKIGPSTAEKIIKYREENGPFKEISDLDNVKGIGAKTIERLRNMICAE